MSLCVCFFGGQSGGRERGTGTGAGGGGDFSRFLALEVVSFFFAVGCGVSVSRSLVTSELWI